MQEQVAHATVYYPKAIAHLGETADPRGEAVLRHASGSPNILVVLSAASGLAELRDEAAVPTILAADKRLSSSMKGLLAHTLVYFSDPRAQAYVRQYLPAQENADQMRRMKPTPYAGVNLDPTPRRLRDAP